MTEHEDVRVASDFQGSWLVSRLIRHASGAVAKFNGTASWTPVNGGLQYLEEGQMTVEGHPPLQAERAYFWADDLTVFFDDGRFFHRVPGKGGAVEHWCDPDKYVLVYDFAGWPRFKVAWHVTGPRKDYSADTEYKRC
ncbi:MAG: DUF6314 family protein [Paracoccaceae bacterium]